MKIEVHQSGVTNSVFHDDGFVSVPSFSYISLEAVTDACIGCMDFRYICTVGTTTVTICYQKKIIIILVRAVQCACKFFCWSVFGCIWTNFYF